MALVTSFSRSFARFLRRAGVVSLAVPVLALAAPALADDAVYIWRDANGAVRFSPVRESAPHPESEAKPHDGDRQPAIKELSSARQPQA